MKKLLLTLTLIISIFLSGCTLQNDETIDSYTKDELMDLIEEMIPEANVSTTYDMSSFQDAIVEMVAQTRNGVLGVVAQELSGSTVIGGGTGSGVVYKKVGDVYYLVTNAHVITEDVTDTLGQVTGTELLDNFVITYEKNNLLFNINEVTVVGYDLTTDLAVLTFTSDEYFSVIEFGDSYAIEPGQFVFAIGNPLGFNYYGTLTMGVISGTSRYLQDGDFDATLLQHDAAISPGNSGGALVDINGKLIGINNMKIVDADVTGIGFAIPSNTVQRIVEDLEDDGVVTRPFLGIVTSAQVNQCGIDYGVCLLDSESQPAIYPNGAADNAELQSGDVIIGFKKIDQEEYFDVFNFNDLKEAILNCKVGDQIQIKYIRDNEIKESNIVTLGVHPDD
ncbi:trypsin-like peptidase domain-containing protein [Candidatus Izimaplasma bacterium ZiA1]|uniref:S1C family serine protease n=1 Tax=Candidatus Izimoplasma sp. ZiA1 TaxID=2024899 RepID=UPI001F0AC512